MFLLLYKKGFCILTGRYGTDGTGFDEEFSFQKIPVQTFLWDPYPIPLYSVIKRD